MGVCLSRCDETHHQAAGPATISHRNYSFDNNTESLKQFLRLHATVDAKTSSLIASPASSLVIPSSSELFSLPASEPDRSSSAMSPASPGRMSRPASASSSRNTNSSSMSRRNSCSWSGRFSVDTTTSTRSCRKRTRIRSCQHGVAAHQRLIQAIARLERLSDGKPLRHLRTSSVSDLGRKDATKLTSMRSRDVRHYQLPLQLPNSALCSPDTTAAVTNFLQEVESFVSLIKAPRETKSVRSAPKAAADRLTGSRCDETGSDEMFTSFEATSSEESEARRKPSSNSTSLHRLVLSATQGCHPVEKLSPGAGKALAAPVAKSRRSSCRIDPPSRSTPVSQSAVLRSRMVVPNIDSALPGIESMREEKSEEAARVALTDIDMNVVAMVKKSPSVRRPSPSRVSAPKGSRRRLSRSLDSRESAVVHVDFETYLFPIAASRLSNVSSNNVTTTSPVTLIDAKSMEDLGLLPVSSISSCLDIRLEQVVCDRKDEENCTVELSTAEQPSPQVEDQSPTAIAESCVREPQSLEQNPSTAQLAANSELPSLQVLPDEDRSPSALASAESSFRERDSLDNTAECPEINVRCEETLATESNECTESASPSLSRCRSTETGAQADFHPISDSAHSEVRDSQRFLSKAFNILFKLLLVTDREQTGHECTAALHQNENRVH